MTNPILGLDGLPAAVALITNVSNGPNIKQLITDGKLCAALINVKQVYDLWQLQVAVHKAIESSKKGKCVTKTVYSEILFNLLPTRQISQAYKVFGMSVNDAECIAVTVGDNSIEDMNFVLQAIPNHIVVPFEEINKYHDVEAIKQTYTIVEKELTVGSLSDAIVSRIAAKELIT